MKYWLDPGTHALDVWGQMGLDEAALEWAQGWAEEAFVLRFYRWADVGATFGYAQRWREVRGVLPAGAEGKVTRCMTGGGVVPHLDDVTFSCVFSAADGVRAGEVYRRLHTAMLAGLREAGLEAWLQEGGGGLPPSGPEGASQCFVSPVELDVMTEEGKVLGGAIRRSGRMVLYQGSLQVPGARAHQEEYAVAIGEGIARAWGGAGAVWELKALPEAVRELGAAKAEKYRGREWIERR